MIFFKKSSAVFHLARALYRCGIRATKVGCCICIWSIHCKPLHKIENYFLCSDPGFKASKELVLYQNRPFTGVMYGLYSGEDTLFYETYREGMLDGKSKKWYSGQRVWQELFFLHGYPEGVQQSKWENGRVRFLIRYTKKQLNGLSEFWYPNGMRKQNNYYKNGKEDGIQTKWGMDGRPHESYMIKNGVITNLITSKNCVYVQ